MRNARQRPPVDEATTSAGDAAASPARAPRRLAPLGLLLLLPLVILWPVLFRGETFYYEDLAAQYFPREQLLMRTGATGWNPHVFFGMGLAGDPQTAAFEPIRALARAARVPPAVAYGLYLGIYLAVATAGMYALSRRKGASSMGAALAVLAGVWGGAYVVRFHHPWMFTTMSLVPWVALCADRLLASPRLGDGIAIGLLIAVGALGGHPQVPYMAALFVAAWLVAGVLFGVPRGRRLRTLWAAGWRASVGLAAMAGLLAFYYAPAVSMLRSSARLRGAHLWWAATFPWDPTAWLRLLVPDLYGNDLAGTYFGPGNYHESLAYIGIAPLLLLALALLWRERRDGHLVSLVAGGAMLAAGPYLPLFYVFYYLVPGFGAFRAPCRYVLFAALCGAVIAGLAASDIAAGKRPETARAEALARWMRRLWAVPAILAVAVAALALLWSGFDAHAEPGAHRTVAWAAARAAVLLVVAGAILEAWLRGAWEGRRTATALLLLTGADVALQWLPYPQTLPTSRAFPAPEVTSALAAVAPARVLVQDLRPNGDVQIVPLLDWGEAAGYYDLRGYNQGAGPEVTELFARGDRDDGKHRRYPDLPAINDPDDWLLDLSGVKRIAARDDEWPARWRELPVVASGGGFQVRERRDPLPRAWLVSGAEVLAGKAALDRLPALALRRVATVDADVDLPAADAGDAGGARLLQYSADRVVVEAQAARPALLVLSDAHGPGWRADVDGVEAAIVKADFLFRGVRLAPGRHQVTFRYDLPGAAAGRRVTITTALALLALLCAWALRRRRPGGWRLFQGSRAQRPGEPR